MLLYGGKDVTVRFSDFVKVKFFYGMNFFHNIIPFDSEIFLSIR